VHSDVKVVEGRRLEPSRGEAVVGRGVVSRYADVALGSELRFGRGSWKIVGIFESAGSSFESEVWVDARELAADARRLVLYSGVRLRAAPGADLDALARRIADDSRWALEATPELAFYAQQSERTDWLYYVVLGIALLAGTGGVFGATNTLYASVQARTAEIGTLRALGFSRPTIARAFIVEATLLSLAGFAIGAAVAWLLTLLVDALLGGVSFPLATFSTSVIALRVTLENLLAAGALALAIGLLGGFAPAVRASRMTPVDALRRA
jgi:ABC-type antimicrobial peptide transport system permease subunit